MMKRVFFGLYCLLLFAAFLQITAFAADASWIKVTDNADFSPRAYFSMQTFDDKMWVIGGLDNKKTYYNDVWYSTDGKTWNPATRSAAFSPRYGHTTVVFDNKMWVIGGYDSSHNYRSDVWYTTDGISWTQATPKAAFPPRHMHTSMVYDGRMWVVGGEIAEKPSVSANDVWSSSDGITWKPATRSAPFPPRMGSGSAVFDDKMWVIGGFDNSAGNVRFNDVWSSSDGKKWEEQTSSAGFSSRYYFHTVTTTDAMWVIGGFDEKALNDIWYSTDGETWNRQSPEPGYFPRYGNGAVVFNDHIWIAGGSDQMGRYLNDVWYFSSGDPGSSAAGLVINKSVSPWSVKQGTDSRVRITFTNAGSTPVHDIEILDTTLPEFPVIAGNNQTTIPQQLMPNETRILVYTIHATEVGRFTLPRTSVIYAGDDGNYHKIQSNAPSIEVIAPLVRSENSANGMSGNYFDNMLKGIFTFFSRK
jgi:hypothetical protein